MSSLSVASVFAEHAVAGTPRDLCRTLAHHAVRCLHAELVLYPKPGLVSRVDNGSHDDMDAATFMRSLFSLRRYFADIAAAGQAGAPFRQLQQLGIAAEQRMLRATGGINTHRGAIFCLGLLCAAIARCRRHGVPATEDTIRRTLLMYWGDSLAIHALATNGQGARQQGAQAFPAVFDIALPQLRATLAAGRDWRCAKIDALFALMKNLDDSNVVRRGGDAGAVLVRERSMAFLAAGGTAQTDWETQALGIHKEFIRHRLSPGGAADLLAAACLVHTVTLDTPTTPRRDS